MQIQEVALNKLRPNPFNVRETPDDEISGLAQQMKRIGFLGDLLGRERDGHVEIAFGHRRLKAARLAGLAAIPVEIRELDDEDMREQGLIENLQRKDWDELEKAAAVSNAARAIIRREKISESAACAQLAKRLGFSARRLQQMCQTDRLPSYAKIPVRAQKISASTARYAHAFGGAAMVKTASEEQIPKAKMEQIIREAHFQAPTVRKAVKRAAAKGRITSPEDVRREAMKVITKEERLQPKEIEDIMEMLLKPCVKLTDDLHTFMRFRDSFHASTHWRGFAHKLDTLVNTIDKFKTQAHAKSA